MNTSDLLFDIDAFVQMKEEQGHEIDDVIDALLEYIEVACELSE